MIRTYPRRITDSSRFHVFKPKISRMCDLSVRRGSLTSPSIASPILDALRNRPSRASAAAIGHHFVLNGAPPTLSIAGINALGEMMCDWSVAILEETINDPTRTYEVRRYADLPPSMIPVSMLVRRPCAASPVLSLVRGKKPGVWGQSPRGFRIR